MTHGRKSYLHAALCALAVFICGLISRPFTTMNICDDGPNIRMAQTLANTGHIVYNGWSASMMAAQLYLGAAFIKLFGFSTTSVRMSTMLLSVLTAIIFHRTLARTGSSERNATLGTLAAVISPLYIMLSVTFMTDIAGLFAITLCLYGCVRAIQASTDRSAIAWICFAVFTCAVFGTSRQIAWLGDLVMVPSTLWLLRSRSRVLLAGIVVTALSFLFILGCTHWLQQQPYSVPVPFLVRPFPLQIAIRQLVYIVLEIPFLVLPVIALFIPGIFRSRTRNTLLFLAAIFAYVITAFHMRKSLSPWLPFEPTSATAGSWINVSGVYAGLPSAPTFLHTKFLVLLTLVCLGGLFGVIAVALSARRTPSPPLLATANLSWRQLGILLLPFSLIYLVFLGAAVGTTHMIYDRYGLDLVGPTMIVLIRLYEERVQPDLPLASVLLIVIMGAFGIFVTHNTFALDRARVDLANELHAQGIPYTSIDGGWDYNFDTELQNSTHLNNPLVKVPKGAYVIPSPVPPGDCSPSFRDETPHVHAVYGISYFSDICYGRAPFAPVQYRAWPFNVPITLYAIRYVPPGS